MLIVHKDTIMYIKYILHISSGNYLFVQYVQGNFAISNIP